jgi:hypothetical protein
MLQVCSRQMPNVRSLDIEKGMRVCVGTLQLLAQATTWPNLQHLRLPLLTTNGFEALFASAKRFVSVSVNFSCDIEMKYVMVSINCSLISL